MPSLTCRGALAAWLMPLHNAVVMVTTAVMLSCLCHAACSSAFLALHDAVTDLQRGRVDYAVVGGSSAIFRPATSLAFLRLKCAATQPGMSCSMACITSQHIFCTKTLQPLMQSDATRTAGLRVQHQALFRQVSRGCSKSVAQSCTAG